MSRTDDPEDREVDFSGGARGRFYRPGAVLIPPVHLDPDVLSAMRERAEKMGVALDEAVNEQLRKSFETA